MRTVATAGSGSPRAWPKKWEAKPGTEEALILDDIANLMARDNTLGVLPRWTCIDRRAASAQGFRYELVRRAVQHVLAMEALGMPFIKGRGAMFWKIVVDESRRDRSRPDLWHWTELNYGIDPAANREEFQKQLHKLTHPTPRRERAYSDVFDERVLPKVPGRCSDVLADVLTPGSPDRDEDFVF